MLRVAIYCRSSTDLQEASIERQLANIRPYCELRQYVIVGQPYLDEGICGDEFSKRLGFQRLLADAQRGLFERIVCDEWSRLSRQNVLEFLATVAQAGVTLETVAEGEQSWDDLAQLILLTIKADKSSSESIKLSHRVSTEYHRRMAAMQLLGGPTPYGLLVVREPDPRKPGRMRPVRYERDPRTAHVVVWIFEQFVAGVPILDMVAELERRGAPPPGAHWSRGAVRFILRNPKYTGAYCWNRQGNSKYHSVGKKGVNKGKFQGYKGVEEWYLVPGVYEPLISQQLFDLAQERLEANRGGRRGRDCYLFSGLVVCGHCGRSMCGKKARGRPIYTCNKYDDAGAVVCTYHMVREDRLLKRLVETLQKEFLDPANLAVLRQEAQRRDEQRVSEAKRRAVRIKELDKHIAAANRKLAIIPDDLIAGVIQQIRLWEAERLELSQDVITDHADQLEKLIQAREEVLWNLTEAIRLADPLILRRVVRQFVTKIEITTDGGLLHLAYLPAQYLSRYCAGCIVPLDRG